MIHLISRLAAEVSEERHSATVRLNSLQGFKFSGTVPDFRCEESAQLRCNLHLCWKVPEPPPNFRRMNFCTLSLKFIPISEKKKGGTMRYLSLCVFCLCYRASAFCSYATMCWPKATASVNHVRVPFVMSNGTIHDTVWTKTSECHWILN